MTESFLKTHAPAVHIHQADTQKVACPYCPGGYVEVTGVHNPEGGLQIPGFKSPHSCVVCKRWFKLEPRVQVVGIPMEGE